ncbi:MAG TPA: M48 family metallopeptidase [Flavobacterium sp.]|nr:M48 family metallopeptidase [Flavobacterium sp.]
MRKILLQGAVILALFLSVWFVFAQIDWVAILKVEKITNKTEEKLGDLFWEIIKESDKEITQPIIVNSVDAIVNTICTANDIDSDFIKVHILENQQVNAFALPNGHLVLYTGLLTNSDSPEELSGVIAHEIAHIELKHVTKKLVKEVGLSALISMATGNKGAVIIRETAGKLSSLAFDRSMEKEADIKAVDYLIKAKINPEPFADFLYKLSDLENQTTQHLNWLSTHPTSKNRAGYVINYSTDKKNVYQEVLTEQDWKELKDQL